jgi:hypothetical protein
MEQGGKGCCLSTVNQLIVNRQSKAVECHLSINVICQSTKRAWHVCANMEQLPKHQLCSTFLCASTDARGSAAVDEVSEAFSESSTCVSAATVYNVSWRVVAAYASCVIMPQLLRPLACVPGDKYTICRRQSVGVLEHKRTRMRGAPPRPAIEAIKLENTRTMSVLSHPRSSLTRGARAPCVTLCMLLSTHPRLGLCPRKSARTAQTRRRPRRRSRPEE